MCGRYSFVVKKEKIQSEFPQIAADKDLPQLFNIAPTQLAPVVTDLAPTKISWMRWGLLPAWSKTKSFRAATFNARMEDLQEKPTWQRAFAQCRCWVLADSFYEWQKNGTGAKIPFRIFSISGKILVFAGLWETWTDGQETIESFTIVTCPPNKEMSSLHNRMPLILDTPEKQTMWLSKKSDTLDNLLVTPPDHLLNRYAVRPILNNSTAQGTPLMHEPLPDSTGTQGVLF